MSSALVLGLGKSGVAAARKALALGHELTVYAGVGNAAARDVAAGLEEMGARVVFDSEDVEGSYDFCIVSPGIPQTGAFYEAAAAAACEIISEPEWAWRLSPDKWIAVTGTNGKTTTTSLVTHLLNACGCMARSCGNIGNTCLESIDSRNADETLVAEMSSYQLASTVRFAPCVAILLNITPDHLSWHGGFDVYAQAKFKVFDNMGPASAAVITDDVIRTYPQIVDSLDERGVPLVSVGTDTGHSCAFEDERGYLMYRDANGKLQELVCKDSLNIKGTHNVENALCASAAALCYGCDVSCVRVGLRSFEPLEHRIEPCGGFDGVSFFNDSKATNVDATLKALTAFPAQGVVLMLGGRDKNTDLSDLVDACEKSCKAVIVYGEAKDRFAAAFAASPLACHAEATMNDAFMRACELAVAGDAVLLSPACASFDEFDSFEHRGDVFKAYVAQAMKDRG